MIGARGLVLVLVSLPLAALAGCASDPAGSETHTCLAGVSEENCASLQALALPEALPESRGNSHADEFNAALLGFNVFFDSRFSSNTSVRCESCHSVDHAFGDNLPVPTAGLAPGVRNSPTIFNAARYDTFFWDGRADSLWSQPLFAFENPTEMNFSRLEIVHLLEAVYQSEYQDAFGALPSFADTARFPEKGAPGNPLYDAMKAEDKQAVNQVVANLGKALEAYMRKIATGPSPVDTYLANGFAPDANGVSALNARQARGMAVFANSGCLQCHGGSQLSDNQFHNLGVPSTDPTKMDPGRSEAAVDELDSNPFNAEGPFFDGHAPGEAPAAAVAGGFRTPSLRNLTKSAPYGHNGSFATLEQAVDFHLQGGGSTPGSFVGTVDPLLKPTPLSVDDRAALIEFLKALEGKYPALPWGQWPNGNG